MTPTDFRRIALTLPNAEESSHMSSPDFRIGGRIFATLAHEAKGFGNLLLTPTQQAEFVAESPDLFLPIPGGWGRHGATHIRLAQATELTLTAALQTAWQLRQQMNARTQGKKKCRSAQSER